MKNYTVPARLAIFEARRQVIGLGRQRLLEPHRLRPAQDRAHRPLSSIGLLRRYPWKYVTGCIGQQPRIPARHRSASTPTTPRVSISATGVTPSPTGATRSRTRLGPRPPGTCEVTTPAAGAPLAAGSCSGRPIIDLSSRWSGRALRPVQAGIGVVDLRWRPRVAEDHGRSDAFPVLHAVRHLCGRLSCPLHHRDPR